MKIFFLTEERIANLKPGDWLVRGHHGPPVFCVGNEVFDDGVRLVSICTDVPGGHGKCLQIEDYSEYMLAPSCSGWDNESVPKYRQFESAREMEEFAGAQLVHVTKIGERKPLPWAVIDYTRDKPIEIGGFPHSLRELFNDYWFYDQEDSSALPVGVPIEPEK